MHLAVQMFGNELTIATRKLFASGAAAGRGGEYMKSIRGLLINNEVFI